MNTIFMAKPSNQRINSERRPIVTTLNLSLKEEPLHKRKVDLSQFLLIVTAKIPPVGHYNLDMFTIQENTKMEQEDDPDLKIERAAFNTGQKRGLNAYPKIKSKIAQ